MIQSDSYQQHVHAMSFQGMPSNFMGVGFRQSTGWWSPADPLLQQSANNGAGSLYHWDPWQGSPMAPVDFKKCQCRVSLSLIHAHVTCRI